MDIFNRNKKNYLIKKKYFKKIKKNGLIKINSL